MPSLPFHKNRAKPILTLSGARPRPTKRAFFAALILALPLIFTVSQLSAGAQADFDRYSYGYNDSPSQYSSRGGGGSGPRISLDLNAKDNQNSALRIAAREERLEDIEKLIKEGADLNSRSETGVTALMYAARNCSPPVIQLLLREKADVNVRDQDGRGALIYAIKESCLEGAKALLQTQGLRWREKDRQGMTALDYAEDMAVTEVDGPAVEILRLLRKLNSTQSRRLRISSR